MSVDPLRCPKAIHRGSLDTLTSEEEEEVVRVQRDESNGEREVVEEVKIRRELNRAEEAEERHEPFETASDESDDAPNEYQRLQCERTQRCRGSNDRVSQDVQDRLDPRVVPLARASLSSPIMNVSSSTHRRNRS